MFDYMIKLTFSDNEIIPKEMDTLFNVGINIFSFNEKEIAQMVAESIHKYFIPKVF